MKLLVVSEGNHELNLEGESGALVELLRRVVPIEFEFERRKVSDSAVQQVAMWGKAGKHEKRLLMWMRFAERNGFDALVLVVDEDGVKDRRDAISNAQLHCGFTIPRALGIAIRSFDAWMLADQGALSCVLEQTILKQPDPERIRDPKELCRSLVDASDVNCGLAEFYFRLAAIIDIDQLCERCSDGFAPFRDHLRLLACR